jgi:hypothetical protein
MGLMDLFNHAIRCGDDLCVNAEHSRSCKSDAQIEAHAEEIGVEVGKKEQGKEQGQFPAKSTGCRQ